MRWAVLPLILAALPAGAETLVAARTLRAQSVIAEADVALVAGEIAGTASDPLDVLGLETRVAIYQGRPIRMGDLGPPAIVDRNQSVTLVYAAGPLVIVAEGRALGRGGVGDRIKVQNTGSRVTVNGLIEADGTVHVASGNSF